MSEPHDITLRAWRLGSFNSSPPTEWTITLTTDCAVFAQPATGGQFKIGRSEAGRRIRITKNRLAWDAPTIEHLRGTLIVSVRPSHLLSMQRFVLAGEGLIQISQWLDVGPDLRDELALALGKMGDASAGELLIQLLDHRVTPVREQAASALRKIGGKALDGLTRDLRSKEFARRWRAALTLGRIGNNLAVPPLIETLKSSFRPGESLGAIWALGGNR